MQEGYYLGDSYGDTTTTNHLSSEQLPCAYRWTAVGGLVEKEEDYMSQNAIHLLGKQLCGLGSSRSRDIRDVAAYSFLSAGEIMDSEQSNYSRF